MIQFCTLLEEYFLGTNTVKRPSPFRKYLKLFIALVKYLDLNMQS